MAVDEFSLIDTYFSACGIFNGDTLLGVGDDCALLCLPAGEVLAVSTDTLLVGVHFPENSPPQHIAQRALLVNLSDMAAMGAKPRWFQLALTLPDASSAWLANFSQGLGDVARDYGCALVGGDTTRGPLSITITLMGTLPSAKALKRSGARPGDSIYVTGVLGDGAGGLGVVAGELVASADDTAYLEQQFWQPQARVDEGLCIRDFASAAIDISDGLLADLGHITERSDVGALIEVDKVPLSPALCRVLGEAGALRAALSGGDDYELCFTVPAKFQRQCQSLIDEGKLNATPIGRIVESQGLRCVDKDGGPFAVERMGYSHF